FCFFSFGFSYSRSQMKEVIGYDAFPGASVMETRKSGGWIFAAALAAVIDSADGLTNSSSEFITAAYFSEPSRLRARAITNGRYPNEPGVCGTNPAVPSPPLYM